MAAQIQWIVVAAALLVASCAPAQQRRARQPDEDVRIPESQNRARPPERDARGRDAYECERAVALAGTGGKATAFNRCMRELGHSAP